MRRPDFFIVGAARSGTTAMKEYLQEHPEVFMPPINLEPRFFGSDLPGPRRFRDERAYLSLFTWARGEKRVGEKSTHYLFSNRAAAEIKAFEPSARIIVMLRNPAEVIYSLHGIQLYYGSESISDFQAALEAEEALRLKGGSRQGLHSKRAGGLLYRDKVEYTRHVRRFFDTFGPERVHVIIFDDLLRDAAGVYGETLRFLEVDPGFRPVFRKVNASRRARSRAAGRLLSNPPQALLRLALRALPYGVLHRVVQGAAHLNRSYRPLPPLGEDLRRKLQAEFRPEVEKLSELLGRDLTHWCRAEAEGAHQGVDAAAESLDKR